MLKADGLEHADGLRIGAVLSISGRFAQFGRQAARGLRVWADLTGAAPVEIIDDGSSPDRVRAALHDLSTRCDLLLGPYSTVLARAAAGFALDADLVVWNHGGAGADVQVAAPRRLVSVLAPTSRYADSFVAAVATHRPGARLRLVSGPGSFGRQVIEGARRSAGEHGLAVVGEEHDGATDAVFCAGTFEHDTRIVNAVLADPAPPRFLGAVAAGVRSFSDAVSETDGVYGVAQWIPGTTGRAHLGPAEAEFVDGYAGEPDYPAVQAAAAATIAAQCARLADSTSADDLWSAAAALRTTTMFGSFEIDEHTGMQVGRSVPLVRWSDGRPWPA